MEMRRKRNEGMGACGQVRRQRGLVMGRGQSVGRNRDGRGKGRGMGKEVRDWCFKEISSKIEYETETESRSDGVMMAKSQLNNTRENVSVKRP